MPIKSKLTTFLIICNIIFGVDVGVAQSDGRQAKIESKKAIHQLKQGVLLVKLYTDSAKIQALHNHYNKKKADAYRSELAIKNQVVIKAFQDHFTFSRVAYFYSTDQDQILKGNLTVLKDGSGNNFELEASDTSHFILDSRHVYFTSMTVDQKGYSILKRDFTALERPFPYYVRKRDATPFLRRDDIKMVKILNERLFEYAEKEGVKK